MDSRNVLVTGGAGYIGSHACQALAAAGFTPVVFDNLSTGTREAVQFGPLEVGDIRDGEALKNVLQKYKPIAVMHFAALIAVGESVTKPSAYYHVNTIGAWTLLNAVRETSPAFNMIPLVFSSTAAVYGIPQVSPIPENAPLAPINPYGHSKLMVEQMLSDFSNSYGLRSITLRYFNAAGSSLDGKLGLTNRSPTHLIPVALEAILGTRDELQIFGTDYPTPDGTAVRDYIHVVDLANAHVAALQYLLKGGSTTTFNLGTGQGHSVQEVIDAVARITNHIVPANTHPRRAGDPPALVADSSRAQKELNWKPEYSDLSTIVGTAWEWRQTLAEVKTTKS
ncbi:MAG: UDP-glucose 4-epimerase GalE [Alphaproteobacteria bacterium]|nr:MAG: UDP-glucose 4-epimerase GalE [Alphaproteobacteria bacterium]